MYQNYSRSKVCAIVPAYKVATQINSVITSLLAYVDHIIVVDDECPEDSGLKVIEFFQGNENITLITLAKNLGVGGAVMAGYRLAAQKGYLILVKVDGDGLMNPAYIPSLVHPIISGEADYTKGNRFFEPDGLRQMPIPRLIGNAGLSFLAKLSTGYWQIMDPTNGFTAIHAGVLPWIKMENIASRYFFETDMLFRLGLINAVVIDIPMPAKYGEEVSNLRIGPAMLEFAGKHIHRFGKRLLYQYFLRGFSLGSLCLIIALPLLFFSLIYGFYGWHQSVTTGITASAGRIMLSALPAIFGVQLLLAFFSLDMARPRSKPLWILVDRRFSDQEVT